jgi:hypothetical protein
MVPSQSVQLFLGIPAKKEHCSFFLKCKNYRILGNSGYSCRNAQPSCLELEAYVRSCTSNDIYMTAGQVPETIMTGSTADISHIAEFGWYDWVMFQDNKASYPDDKLILGRYLGPADDTRLALMAKILKSNGVFVCRSTLRHLTDEELDSSVHKDMRGKFDESIEHHLVPAALPQDFPA